MCSRLTREQWPVSIHTCSIHIHDVHALGNCLSGLICTSCFSHCFYSSFVRPEVLEQLVKLVTLEPEDDAEDKVKFK